MMMYTVQARYIVNNHTLRLVALKGIDLLRAVSELRTRRTKIQIQDG